MAVTLVSAQYLPFPGTCCSCGNSKVDCVDFGITFPFDGAFLVCVSCFEHAVEVCNIGVSSKKFRKISDQLDEARRRDNALVEALVELQDGVSHAVANFAGSVDSIIERDRDTPLPDISEEPSNELSDIFS